MKTQDLFGSFYDPQDSRLNKLGDPLARLGEAVDRETFRPLLGRVRPTARKSNAGTPRRDEVLMFKGLVIQRLYGLSDEQLEYQPEDRRSFHCARPWAQPFGQLPVVQIGCPADLSAVHGIG